MRVEVRFEEFLGPRWHPAVVEAEISGMLEFGIVSVFVDTFEDEPFDSGSVRYYLLIGPPQEGGQTVDLWVHQPFVGHTRLSSWDVRCLTASGSHEEWPSDLVHNSLGEKDVEGLLNGIIDAVGAPFEIRSIREKI